jgi:NADH dehydrogenase
MFAPDDAFLNTLVQLLRRLPIYPMFGRGQTRLQPADVEDVAESVDRLMQRTPAEAITVECGGPRVYTYEELLRTIGRAANVKPVLVPAPFAAWHALAWVAELLANVKFSCRHRSRRASTRSHWKVSHNGNVC